MTAGRWSSRDKQRRLRHMKTSPGLISSPAAQCSNVDLPEQLSECYRVGERQSCVIVHVSILVELRAERPTVCEPEDREVAGRHRGRTTTAVPVACRVATQHEDQAARRAGAIPGLRRSGEP
jgi:hypothetical protein